MTPRELATAADVDALARALYGDVPVGDGVVHVTALYQPPDGEPRTLRIGPDSPKSDHDFFALNLTRARADAILVTGKILRDEPGLRYDLQGPGSSPRALAAWRRERARRSEPPLLCVLTSGRGLDASHPALASWARPVLFTSEEGRRRLADSPLDVVAASAPSARAAIAYLREERGARCVSIEAGPSTSRALYDDPPLIDELLLSRFAPADPPRDDVVGREGVPLARVRELLGDGTEAVRIDEPSGPWLFNRFRR